MCYNVLNAIIFLFAIFSIEAVVYSEAEKRANGLDDSKIIELFYERSEQAIIKLSKKYGEFCRRIADNILTEPEKRVGPEGILLVVEK